MDLIDIVIITAFFLITFIIGIIERRKLSLEDYWVNGRKTGTFLLIATVLSTFIGAGSLLFNSNIFFFLFYYLLYNKFFAPKIKEFGDLNRAYTLPDFFGYKYSERSRVVSTIINLTSLIFYLALHIVAIGVFVNLLTGFNPIIANLIGGLIVIAYTAVGGIRADIRTDVFQFFVMLFLLIVFLPIVIIKAGGFSAITALPKSFLIGADFAPFYVFILAFFFVGTSIFSFPDLWQRTYAAKDKNSIKRSGVIISILILLFLVMGTLLGIFGKLVLPNSSSNSIIADLLNQFLPVGLYGLVVAGFFAAIMSSSDTILLNTSMTLVRDVYQKILKNKASEEHLLKLSRTVTLIVGILGLIVGIIVANIAHLSIEAVSFNVVLVPAIVFGFYWRKANDSAAFWSILLGALAITAFLFIDPVQAFIPGTIVSFGTYLLITWFRKVS